MSDELEELYGPAIVVNSEGFRLSLVTCLKCGAAVMSDPLDVTPRLTHLEWHKAQEENKRLEEKLKNSHLVRTPV